MEVGNINSKHLFVALKVKSMLDPCEDENHDIQDDAVSLGADSVQWDDSSDSNSETAKCQPQKDNGILQEDNCMSDEAKDDTQDPEEDEQKISRIKDWICSCELAILIDTAKVSDVHLNFPDISVVLTEEIMEKLVVDGTLARTGGDTYTINRPKKSDYEFTVVKQDINGQAIVVSDRTPKSNDHLYMGDCDACLVTIFVYQAINLVTRAF